MKATIINGKKVVLRYRTRTEGVLTALYAGKKYYNLRCYVYEVEGDTEWRVLVLGTEEFKDIPSSLTLIPASQFYELKTRFGSSRHLLHAEFLTLCGAEPL